MGGMFETVSVEATVDADGHVRVDLPVDLAPGRSVRVTVAEGPKVRFATREEWEAHVDRIAGSIPDLERPDQGTLREIEPL
jgi:hypothetical protein